MLLRNITKLRHLFPAPVVRVDNTVLTLYSSSLLAVLAVFRLPHDQEPVVVLDRILEHLK